MSESSSSDIESNEINEILHCLKKRSNHSVKKIKLRKKQQNEEIRNANFTLSDKSANKLTIKYHKINAKIDSYKNLSQLSIQNSLMENDENIEKKIFANAEKKVFLNSKSTLFPRNVDHYILDRPKKYFNIHNNITLNNLIHNNLIGEINYIKDNTIYKRYLAIKSTTLYIYNYILKSEEQEKYDVICDKDDKYIYRAEKILNLKKSEIYITSYKNLNMYSFLSYFYKQNKIESKINITNKQIVKIFKNNDIFTIKLKEEANKTEFQTTILEFSLFTKNIHFIFRPKNISDFLRWTFAFYYRQK